MENSKELKDIIAKIMQERNYNQTTLSIELGVRQSQVSNWVNGKSTPGFDNIRTMAKVLNLSADFLLGLSEKPN